MTKYIVKRLLVLIPILLGVTLIIFTIMDFTPGDPAVRILGPESSIEAREQLREELGLNQPFWVRFFDYVKDVFLKLDFGNSYRTGKPVFDDIFMRLPVSIKVAFLGMLLATVMGLPLGVLSAVKQYSPADSFLRVASTVLVAMPTFWLAMLLILVFALYLGWLPAGGALTWQSYILPTITVGVPYGSKVLRMTRLHHAGGDSSGLRSYGSLQGCAGKEGHLWPCLEKRIAAGYYHDRFRLRRHSGRLGHCGKCV